MKSSKPSKSPAPATGKKLVQARLPFKKLSTPTNPLVTTPAKPEEVRKRKLSNSGAIDDESVQARKINRTDDNAESSSKLTPIVASISLVDTDDENDAMKSVDIADKKAINDSKSVDIETIKEDNKFEDVPIIGDDVILIEDKSFEVSSIEPENQIDKGNVEQTNETVDELPPITPDNKKKSKKSKKHKEKKLVWDEDESDDTPKGKDSPVLIKIPFPRKRKTSTKKSETVKSLKMDEDVDEKEKKPIATESKLTDETATIEPVVETTEIVGAEKEKASSDEVEIVSKEVIDVPKDNVEGVAEEKEKESVEEDKVSTKDVNEVTDNEVIVEEKKSAEKVTVSTEEAIKTTDENDEVSEKNVIKSAEETEVSTKEVIEIADDKVEVVEKKEMESAEEKVSSSNIKGEEPKSKPIESNEPLDKTDITTDTKAELNEESKIIDEKNDDKMEVDEEPEKSSPILQQNESSNQSIISILSDDVKDPTEPEPRTLSIADITTPKRKPASAAAANVSTTPTGQKLTPKQLQRLKESEKKQLERQRAKEDRDRKLQEEKEQKQRERDEKERQRRKEKEEREEQKRREKEDRDRKRQAEIDAKNEERKRAAEQKEEERKKIAEQKEEERKKLAEQKEEERRKKEEEKQLAEEAKNKEKQKQKAAFTKFFVVKKTTTADADGANDRDDDVQQQVNAAFMPFQVKDDMKLAPIVRRKLTASRRKEIDEIMQRQNDKKPLPTLEDLYVMNLRTGTRAPERDIKTWLTDDDDSSDVMIVYDEINQTGQVIKESKPKQLYRAKFLKFEENRRPPYYGTWRKSSKKINARKPFTTDTKFFDYDVDSDDEWEEEEPGESLNGSDDEKESVDDYDIDNEFFVPHGHLSDEELEKEDELDEDNSPAAQKARLQIVQKQFADEMKKKTEKIKPRLIGLIWQTKDGTKPDSCPPVIWDTLNARAMIYQGLCVLMCKPTKDSPADTAAAADSDDENTDATKSQKRVNITEDAVADLIRLIHGNTNNRNFLVNEFRAYLCAKTGEETNFSIISIRKKIKELAKYGPCPEDGFNKYCWYVSEEKRRQYDVTNLTMPNVWTYVLKKSKKVAIETENNDQVNGSSSTITDDPIKQSTKGKSASASASTTVGSVNNITKFTTILTEDEKKKKFEMPDLPTPSTSAISMPKNVDEKPKKRVNLLMSGPCGQEISTTDKDAAVRKFLNDSQTSATKSATNNNVKMTKSKSNGSGGIMKFATKLTDEQKRKKFEISSPMGKSPPKTDETKKTGNGETLIETKSLPIVEKPKKRVNLLVSVPCGETIPDSTKNEAVRKFLSSNKMEKDSANASSVVENIVDTI